MSFFGRHGEEIGGIVPHITLKSIANNLEIDAILEKWQPTLARLLYEINAVLEEACDRDAHERARRFQSAPLTLSFTGARQHVEGRAEDLAQVRPEWGHATLLSARIAASRIS